MTACGDPEDAWTETDHLRVRADDGDLCAGTPPALEREVVRLIDAMNLPELDETIDVVLGPDASDRCMPGYDACAGRIRGGGRITVLSSVGLVTHELVHAVRQAHGEGGPSFYEEGLAEVLRAGAFAPHEILASSATVDDIDALQLEKLTTAADYATAGSFVAWLHANVDPPLFATAFNGATYDGISNRSELESWFDDALAMPLDDAQTRWVATQPREHELAGPCLANEPMRLVDGVLEASGRVDCDDDVATIGPLNEDASRSARSEWRCVDVAGVPRIELVFDATTSLRLEAFAWRCDTGERFWTTSLFGGRSETVELDACWLRLVVRGPADDVADYRWSITAR